MTSKLKVAFKYSGAELDSMGVLENYYQWIVSRIHPYVRGKVAEIGAGVGTFSSYLNKLEQVQSLHLFEPDISMCEQLHKFSKNNNNIYVRNMFFEEDKQPEAFNAIVYINVLEHIEDDKKELENVFAALSKNGYVILFVPAFQCLYAKMDEEVGHYRRYHKYDLENKLKQAGFNIVKSGYMDVVGFFTYFVSMKLFKATLSKKNLSVYDKLVVPFSRFIDRLIPCFIGKSLMVIAEKKEC